MTRKVSNSHYVNNQERAIEFITAKTSFDSYLITLCLQRLELEGHCSEAKKQSD